MEPFLAFGNGRELFVKGRVISSYRQNRPRYKNGWIKNVFAAIKRYSVSVLPEVEVKIGLGEMEYIVETDQDGVFEAMIPEPEERVEHVTFQLQSASRGKVHNSFLNIERFFAEKGVISDIDDTILISHSTDIGRKFWLSVSKNAYTRRPFPGVSEFYNRLTDQGRNPLFYVSSSDWSLYELIQDFLRFRKIPKGPLLLKDKHINLKNVWKSGGGNHDHKLEKIRLLFAMYPATHWTLIGDSGQHDPEIYQQIYKEFPGRVLGVIIREVKPSRTEEEINQRLAKYPEFFFVETTEEAVAVAEKLNLF